LYGASISTNTPAKVQLFASALMNYVLLAPPFTRNSIVKKVVEISMLGIRMPLKFQEVPSAP
jgi:hypothetical protein